MIIGNTAGFIMLAIAFGIAYLGGRTLGLSYSIMGALTGLLAAGFDLTWRIAKKRSMTKGDAGGSLFFLPVWIIAAVWIAISLSGVLWR